MTFLRAIRVEALILSAFVVSVYLCLFFVGHQSKVSQEINKSDIVYDDGFAYSVKVEIDIPSDSTAFHSSSLRVLENGIELDAPHTYHQFIVQSGNGGFIHYHDKIVFSSSDRSSPIENSKEYSFVYKIYEYTFFSFGLLILSVILLFIFWFRLYQKLANTPHFLTGALHSLVAMLLVVLISEYTGRFALSKIFESRGEFVEALHNQVFGIESELDIGWMAARFSPRPYTMYGLNPDRFRSQKNEINSEYLVRRAEPIRDRKDVKTRILVVGGSTTFDDQIVDESQTWVYRVEAKLRERLGNGIDVINGGVGGYTIYENFIHYITLLNYLEPDIILFFTGINDVNPRLFNEYAKDYGNYTRSHWAPSSFVVSTDNSILSVSAAYRAFVTFDKITGIDRTGIGSVVRKEFPPQSDWLNNLKRNPPSIYEVVLSNFTILAKGLNAEIGIIPQYFIPRNESDELFKVGVDENNQVNQQVAMKLGVKYFGALLDDGRFISEDTNDNCHFNSHGAEKMATYVYQFLRDDFAL